ncbi:hypothetical protein [Clostridioides sp. ES-S-0048-02]|uniref:hypothetical protein n=1 Tax=Clostridioides sp. ES-S-0048-02 TaxID=2770777 RepID=UPI001D12CF98|nr:hypothetical protein [Clostridioides sp. ES-S-0048-02]
MVDNEKELNLLKEIIENETGIQFDTLKLEDILLSIDSEEYGRYELFKIVEVEGFLFLIECDEKGNLIKYKKIVDALDLGIEPDKKYILDNTNYIRLNKLNKKDFRKLVKDYSFTNFN